MNIKPLYDRVLVKRLQVEGKTAGGVVILDVAKEKPVGAGFLSFQRELPDRRLKPLPRIQRWEAFGAFEGGGP